MRVTRKQSKVISLLIVIGFFVTVGLLSGSKEIEYTKEQSTKDSQKTTTQEKPSSESQVQLDNFHRVQTKDGVKEWEVKAITGEYFAQENMITLEKSILWMYRPGQNDIKLSSNHAQVFLEKTSLSTVTVEENVRIYIGTDVEVITDKAYYDAKTGKITSDTPVTIISESSVIDAAGFSTVVDSEIISLKGPVKTKITPQNIKQKAKNA